MLFLSGLRRAVVRRRCNGPERLLFLTKSPTVKCLSERCQTGVRGWLWGQRLHRDSALPKVGPWRSTVTASAVEAAGEIHSDIQRGFIRAEIVGYEGQEEPYLDLGRAAGDDTPLVTIYDAGPFSPDDVYELNRTLTEVLTINVFNAFLLASGADVVGLSNSVDSPRQAPALRDAAVARLQALGLAVVLPPLNRLSKSFSSFTSIIERMDLPNRSE